MSRTRSFLYGLARFLGDIEAIQKGPKAVARRIVRKTVYRAANSAVRKIFK